MIWAICAAYLIGWLLAIRPALRARMLKVVCPKCDDRWSTADHRCHRNSKPAPRGSLREREGRDVAVAVAVFVAAFWPPHLAWRVLAATVGLLGNGVTAAVTRVTPLTGPELERRIREQQAEIERLTDQMGTDG
jgi:hypothetical protein